MNKELMNIVELITKKSDYFVTDILGKGGFAVVFSGESQYEDDKNQYALKIVDSFEQGDKYLSREKQINNKLKLKNIPFVIGFYNYVDLSEKFKLFVLEKAETTLDKLILEERQKNKINGLSELKTFFFFSQLLNAVNALHEEFVAHRDLKPQNVLVLNYQLKICDFTTAKDFRFSNENDGLHTSLGTANFNSPEAFNPKEKMFQDLLPSTDIYSLGIIFYYLFFGCNPYKIKDIDSDPDFEHLIQNINYNINNKKPSDSFIELFKRLIEINLEKRISIKQIRDFPWYKEMQSKLKTIYPNSVRALYDFKQCYLALDKYEKGIK
jgi:serine/threonine protein kinase